MASNTPLTSDEPFLDRCQALKRNGKVCRNTASREVDGKHYCGQHCPRNREWKYIENRANHHEVERYNKANRDICRIAVALVKSGKITDKELMTAVRDRDRAIWYMKESAEKPRWAWASPHFESWGKENGD